jgi:hypothetical protein
VSSPTRPNRRGVTVPFRVLPGSEVAGPLGCPLPVRPQRSQNARPFRYFFLHPHPRTRLLGRSSHGVRPSFTVYLEASAPGLSTEGTSLGVPSPLQRSRRRESTSQAGFPARAPWWCQGVRQRVPPRQLRCRSQVFPTSQRRCSSPRRPAIFRRVTFVGFCPSGIFLPRSPDDSSPPAYPLDVPPIELRLIPVLGGDARGHSG